MIALDEFIRDDRSKANKGSAEDSLIYRIARALWLRALKGAHSELSESWSLAIVNACTGENPVNPPREFGRKRFIIDNVIPSFCETLLKHKKKFERDPLWIEASNAENPVDRDDMLEKFLWGCGERWRRDCIDKWRDTRGTFAYVHRRSQKILHKVLRHANWGTYGPKSMHYGPQGMVDPPYLDEGDKEVLESIELPHNAPEENRIFFEKHAVPLAKWLYSQLNMIKSSDETECYERAAVAIRNYARWLCFKYPGLLSCDAKGASAGMEQPVYGGIAESMIESEVRQIASAACKLLTSDQREIVTLKLYGLNLDEIAARFKKTESMKKSELADSRKIQQELNRILRILRDFRMRSPLMGRATDEESAEDRNRNAEELFIHYFIQMCANPSE